MDLIEIKGKINTAICYARVVEDEAIEQIRRMCDYPMTEGSRIRIMPTIDMVATGRNIMRLREVAGLTVRDLQDIFGFATPQAIYKWQHGTAMPTIDNLVVLAAVLDVPMDEIIVIDVNRTKQISA